MKALRKPTPDARAGVLRTGAVVLLIAAVYFGCVWFQMDQCRRTAVAVEERSAQVFAVLSVEVKRLREDPSVASPAVAELSVLETDLASQLVEVGRMGGSGPRLLPASVDPRPAYQRALQSYVSEVKQYEGRLSVIATLVVARTESIRQMSKGFDALQKLSEPGITEEDVTTTLEGVRRSVDGSVAELRSIAASAPTVYSSTGLIARLSAVSAVIGSILSSLEQRDAKQLDASARSFGELMNGEWKSLLVESDTKGLIELASRMRVLGERRARVASAREALSSTEKLTGLAALLLLGAAVALAVFSRRPRNV